MCDSTQTSWSPSLSNEEFKQGEMDKLQEVMKPKKRDCQKIEPESTSNPVVALAQQLKQTHLRYYHHLK